MISLLPPVHALANCPCGHEEHVRREFFAATNDMDQRRAGGMKRVLVVCHACVQIEKDTELQMVFVTAGRAEQLGLASGQAVTVAKASFRVADVEPITKLDGHIQTGWCRVMLRRVA